MQEITVAYTKNKWRVMHSYSVCVDGVEITIPEGFKTDLASVPRFLWAIFPPFGKHNNAAIVHDYLYKTKKVDRKKADKIFLTLMKESKVFILTRWIYFLAVRIFGWVAYH